MTNYFSSSDNIVTVTTPTVQFNNEVPTSFINEFIRRMAKGQIRVYDAKGNELKVYYDAN
jgi:hypothetical protein